MQSRRSLWMRVLFAALLAVATTAPQAQRGAHPAPHPVYEPYRPPTERATRAEERHLNLDDLARDSDSTAAEAQTAEQKQLLLNSWAKITSALGAPTRVATDAYLAVMIGSSGRAMMTTNYLRDVAADRMIREVSLDDLKDHDRLAAILEAMIGPSDTAPDVKLKLLLNGSLESSAITQFFDTDLKSFRFNTDRFRFAELIPTDGTHALSLERIDREGRPPRWVARLNTCCVYGGIPPDIASWLRLANMPFHSDGMQVVSLFADTTATSLLRQANIPLALERPEQITGDLSSMLQEIFASGDVDAPVVVIGHVENGAFKVETADGGTISIDEITRLAREAHRPVYLIGCLTAEHYRSADANNGADYPALTMSVLHPRELGPRLASAIRNSATLQDFTALLSDESLYIWVPNGFMQDRPGEVALRSRIFSVTQNGLRAVTAFFSALIPCRLGACQ